MKLYLASFLQPQNFGPGRIVGIVNGPRPDNLKVHSKFEKLAPSKEILSTYEREYHQELSLKAGENFVSSFQKQLEEFSQEVQQEAASSLKTCPELLPFLDGDTLCSWERDNRTNYRPLVANCLQQLGYEVVLN